MIEIDLSQKAYYYNYYKNSQEKWPQYSVSGEDHPKPRKMFFFFRRLTRNFEMCWKNGTFSVLSSAMTIDISKFAKKWQCMWTISRATADSLRHAGGTIVELYNLQAY